MQPLIVTAGYVTVETALPGGGRAEIDIPRGDRLPEDVPAEQVEALLRLGRVAPIAAAAVGESAPAEFEPGSTIDKTLAWVGDDPEKARTALAAEVAEGGKNRPKLIAKLEAIAKG